MWKGSVLVLAVIGLIAGAAPAVVMNTETFDAGTGNWAGNDNVHQETPGAGGSAGYLYAQRAAPSTPILRAHGASSGGLFTWPLKDRYGEGGANDSLAISFDVKAVGDARSLDKPVTLYIVQEGEKGAWKHLLDPFTAEWTNRSTTVKFDWSDAEANAADWNYESWGDPAIPFATVMNAAPQIRITQEGVGVWGLQQIGIDNFTMTGVPEPATLAVLFAGGLLLARRRR